MSKSVDLNDATSEELQQVCDLGAITARTIVRFRPFRHIDQLEKLPGMSVQDVLALKRLGCIVHASGLDTET